MSKTRVQIQFKSFAILTGGDVGTGVSAEDATALDEYIDCVVDELNSDGTIYVDDPDELDNALFITFCKLVANSAAHEFSSTKTEAELQTEAHLLRNRLRVLVRQTPGYSPQTVEYF